MAKGGALMLNEYSWNMTGYTQKHTVDAAQLGFTRYVAERIFQLEPEPPKADNINEYILSALREKDLKYFSFSSYTTMSRSSISASGLFSAPMAATSITRSDLWT